MTLKRGCWEQSAALLLDLFGSLQPNDPSCDE